MDFDGITWIKRPAPEAAADTAEVQRLVSEVLARVKTEGDAAVADYARRFDKAELDRFEVTPSARQAAVDALDPQTRADTEFAIANVRRFAEAQLACLRPLEMEVLPGAFLGHRVIPVERVGCYVPGGRFPLLSAPIMTIVPAKVAGVDEVIACLPPNAHQAMVAGCHLSGADRIFRIGGAQAIAALAFGTETVPAVDKIMGPGNAFVNEAKRQVFGPVGIDQLAGPSEIYILADGTGDAEMIATDLLAQAEHDVRTRVGLITTDADLGRAVLAEVERQLATLSTAAVAGPSWTARGRDRGGSGRGRLGRLLRPHRRRAPAGPHRRRSRFCPAPAELRLALRRRAGERGLFRQVRRHEPHAADHGGGPLHRRALGRVLRQGRHAPMARRARGEGRGAPGRAAERVGRTGRPPPGRAAPARPDAGLGSAMVAVGRGSPRHATAAAVAPMARAAWRGEPRPTAIPPRPDRRRSRRDFSSGR
ncbi:Histidinol dehydrogenase [Rubellimicrobium mesophilum DSM 19309]|uniref:Histidinol dehydrogenase n=1 Tax=Rubellimicrobium mesophilum DSM 19309 TaxID=442562 RepID=A0A017HSS4_9RHOB|nr:Histidinol dehydrogenase [Rubellimicrobium mesophilum DSM 19309]